MDKNDIFGGFSEIAASLSNQVNDDRTSLEDNLLDGNDPIRNAPVDDDKSKFDDELTEEEKNILKLKKEKAKSKKDPIEKDNDDDEDDDDDEQKGSKTTTPNTEDVVEEDEIKEVKKVKTNDDITESDLGEYEPDVAAYLQEKLYDKFGVDFEESDLDNIKSVDEVVEFVNNMVEDKSVPTYPIEELAQADEFVRNGGDFYEYLNTIFATATLENADLTDENTQKNLIKEDLLNHGISEAKIKRRIEKFEELGMLDEEAEEALESLKEFRENEDKRLLEEQKKQAEESKRANLEFVNSVESTLESIDNILGTKVSKAEKAKLFDYMMKPTENGIPQYHIDYAKDRKNMIESAYFTMMGDKMIKKVEKKTNTKITKRLKGKLADKPRGIDQSTPSSSIDSWGSVFKALR